MSFPRCSSAVVPLARLLFLFLAPPGLSAADWPQWRGLRHDGRTEEALGPVTGLEVVWTAEAGTGFSSFAVVAGSVHTLGNRDGADTVWCFDAATGAVRWSHTYPCALHPKYYEGGPGATPTVAADAVFTLSKRGHAFALDPATGAVRWQRDLVADHGLELPEWNFAGSPFLAGDLVVLNAGRAGIALDRRTGMTVWSSGPEPTGYSTPVPLPEESGWGRDTVALFLGKAMAGIECRTGRETWRIPWSALNATDPIVSGRDVLLSSIGGSAVMRVAPDGSASPVWERKDYQHYFNPPVKVGDHLYGFDGTTHRPTAFVCVEWATGRERWRVEGHATGGLIAAADVLVLCDRGEILLVRPDPEKPDIVFRETFLPGTCWTAPVLSGGRIYARNAAGRVICLRPVRGERD
jgi:outer membrane protein assembly factor BamB